MIIVDYGNVLFDIDFTLTVDALANLDGYNGKPIQFGVEDQNEMFVEFDKGALSVPEFHKNLRDEWGFTCTDEELTAAWCAILKGPFPHWKQTMTDLKAAYPDHTFVLLSNISVLHLEHVRDAYPSDFIALREFFDRQYFSYQMGLRKPDPAAFLHVCEREGTTPDECILFDDSSANCEAAKGLGMSVVRVTPGDPHLASREPERA